MLDKSLFLGSVSNYKLFKEFDCDKDGHITKHDIITELNRLNIPNDTIDSIMEVMSVNSSKANTVNF
jgi:Ca2+-binding EF-hand superfamily protein